jgi:protein-L-isoaspartate(D-aspartate) O-methyltransferase
MAVPDWSDLAFTAALPHKDSLTGAGHMTDFAAARRKMVDGQVRTFDIPDLRIQGAMLEIARERFVPASHQEVAYLDREIPVAADGTVRRLIKPAVLAKLIHLAALTEQDRVLDIACASGYSSAVLGKIAARVTALESEPRLAELARHNLAEAGAANVTVECGPLAQGWPAAAPYDVILINGAVELVPPALIRQLAEHGRLMCVMARPGMGQGTVYRVDGGHVTAQSLFDAGVSPLAGFEKPLQFVF